MWIENLQLINVRFFYSLLSRIRDAVAELEMDQERTKGDRTIPKHSSPFCDSELSPAHVEDKAGIGAHTTAPMASAELVWAARDTRAHPCVASWQNFFPWLGRSDAGTAPK
jgi:hypothetical protein